MPQEDGGVAAGAQNPRSAGLVCTHGGSHVYQRVRKATSVISFCNSLETCAQGQQYSQDHTIRGSAGQSLGGGFLQDYPRESLLRMAMYNFGRDHHGEQPVLFYPSQ
jgi:hypothetical protein